jgi:hypothetical protein
MMKTKTFLMSALLFAAVGAQAADDKFIETTLDPNVEPGRDTTVDLDKLYPLVGVPTQVVLHPKVLSRLGTLQQMGDKAVAEAKTASPDMVFTGAVISAQTWARKIATGEQKFWVFQIAYRKGPKDKPLEAPTIVAHFVSGAYTFHNGNKVFKLESNPSDHFPFIGTFEPKAGAFTIPAPAPTPAP